MSSNKRAADAQRVRDVEALLERRYFVLDLERWATFQAAVDASARANPRLNEGVSEFLSQFGFRAEPLARKPLILQTHRDVRVVEGARLEIALAICDGVLRISITVAKPTT